MNTTAFDRNRHYQLLAIGKKELGWDDEFYYGIWLPMMGASKRNEKYSASTLTDRELVAAVSDMRAKGFQIKPGKQANGNRQATPSQRTLAGDGQSKKMRSLWIEMAEQGIVRDASEVALAKFVHGMTGVEALQWLTTQQASRVIENLKRWQKRELAKRAQV